jgi:hypothetical protein
MVLPQEERQPGRQSEIAWEAKRLPRFCIRRRFFGAIQKTSGWQESEESVVMTLKSIAVPPAITRGYGAFEFSI